jgi:glucose-6-phosphate 1-epimerase
VGASVRGGVPVIFPQFNERGPLPRHGLVRTRSWTPVQSVVRGEHAIATLRFTDDMATRTHWPHGFTAELTVSVAGRDLDIELCITNTGETSFDFHAALHTYLRCQNVEKAQLEACRAAITKMRCWASKVTSGATSPRSSAPSTASTTRPRAS